MKIGSLIICVDDSPGEVDGGITLVNGNFYVISAIVANGNGLQLEEDSNMPPDIEPDSYGYYTRRFREVQPPMTISIEELLTESQPA